MAEQCEIPLERGRHEAFKGLTEEEQVACAPDELGHQRAPSLGRCPRMKCGLRQAEAAEVIEGDVEALAVEPVVKHVLPEVGELEAGADVVGEGAVGVVVASKT